MGFKEIFEGMRAFVQLCGTVVWLAIAIKILIALCRWKP